MGLWFNHALRASLSQSWRVYLSLIGIKNKMKNTLIRRYVSKSKKARDVSCGQVSKNEWGGEVWCFNAFGSSLSRFLSSFGFSSQVILTLPYRFRISIHGRDNRRSEQHELGRWFPEEEPDSSFQHQETIVLLRQPRQGTHFSIYLFLESAICLDRGDHCLTLIHQKVQSFWKFLYFSCLVRITKV